MTRRIPTYVVGLDNKLQGGIPEGHVILVCGRAGSMKSTFCFNLAYNHAKSGNGKSLYITLEQHADSMIWQMETLGMNPRDAKNLTILDLVAIRDTSMLMENLTEKQDWLGGILRGIHSHKGMHGCDVVFIDSLDALYTLTSFEENPRVKLFNFIEAMREMKITSFLISEIRGPTHEQSFGHFGVESYLCDGIIHLDLRLEGRHMGLHIGIPKMRGTNHTRTYYPFIADKKGFRIVEK